MQEVGTGSSNDRQLQPEPKQNRFTGFEILTAVVMKSTIFWDITPCSPLKVNRGVGGTYRLNLQSRRRAPPTTCFRAGFPPKLRLTLNGLHSIISQKMVLFMFLPVFCLPIPFFVLFLHLLYLSILLAFFLVVFCAPRPRYKQPK
jgi:hypothetical protein